MMSEDVLAARFGNHDAKLGKRCRAEQRIDATSDPCRQEERGRRQPGRDVPRRPHDTGADAVADDDGDAEGDAEDLKQATG